jgi:hypothetical protein
VYAYYLPWIHFTDGEVGVLLVLFVFTIFLMPAVFMQVSLEGSYWGATNFLKVPGRILAEPLAYLQAWFLSMGIIALSVVSLPLFPWVTFWGYLAIGHFFNEALSRDTGHAAQERTCLLRIRLP